MSVTNFVSKNKYIGYEVVSRFYFPADEVRIEEELDKFREIGSCEITDVVVFDSQEEAGAFLNNV